jgi:hypothetical protein
VRILEHEGLIGGAADSSNALRAIPPPSKLSN